MHFKHFYHPIVRLSQLKTFNISFCLCFPFLHPECEKKKNKKSFCGGPWKGAMVTLSGRLLDFGGGHCYLEWGALGANARLQFLNECVLLLGYHVLMALKTNIRNVTLQNLKSKTLISFRVIVNLDLRFISACSHSAMRALNACWEVFRSLMGLSSPP